MENPTAEPIPSFIEEIHQIHKSLSQYQQSDFIIIRKRALKKIVDLIEKEKLNSELFEKIRKLEECIYATTLKHRCVYDPFGIQYYFFKFNDIFVNMNPNSYVKNTELLDKFLNGEMKPEQIVFGNEKDLFKQRWKELIDDYNHMIEDKAESLKNVPTTDIYKCYKCGQRKCTYVEQQTRSLDEPHTIFVRCMNPICGNTWKI